jgi:hypothetical protein
MKSIIEFSSLLGVKPTSGTIELLKDIENQKQILFLPDEFNKLFSDMGWFAYESMSATVIEKAIKYMNTSGEDAAKSVIIKYYNKETIRSHIKRMNVHESFKIRMDLIYKAFDDYEAERYYSCIPLLLMMCDGIVNDVTKSKGLAADATNMEVWDCVAGHSSSLEKAKTIFVKGRNKTTCDKITLPYRNCILHGRDLNYANKELATKCWNMLFAIRDWTKSYISENDRKTQYEKKQKDSEKPLVQIINGYFEHKEKMTHVQQSLDSWKKRNITPSIDFPESGKSEEYLESTPERAVVKFIEYLQSKNYGYMSKMMNSRNKIDTPAELRRIFSGYIVNSFKINEVIDCAPSTSEIKVILNVSDGLNTTINKQVTFRMIFENELGKACIRDVEAGEWKIIYGHEQISAL